LNESAKVNGQHSNRLANSASPYLRSAAHQPVDWHEWGDAAFDRARAENKPILLDIGAVWCHWCHVIDRESYENPEISAIINRLFVAVKVDRDERPDVDARYQTAVSAVSGQGGWPLTAFLTPDGKPFFGGTYFPPEDAMGRPGFRRILMSMAQAYESKREDVERAAVSIEEAVRNAAGAMAAPGTLSGDFVPAMTDAIVARFDSRNGGFGQAPKFPHSSAIDLLLERYQATGEKRLLEVAETTLEKMARGGVYDQIGRGFHRYSVDERWLVPHFEKMAYDNSGLLRNYLHGWQVSGNPLFREVAEGIINWTFDVMADREKGGFFSSQDADISLDDDGDYFTWTQAELRAALPAADAAVMEIYYDVAETGEMHHDPARNVLWIAATPAEIAKRLGRGEAEVGETIRRAKAAMLAARKRRTAPAIDRTIYTGWNGLYISAFLEAGRVLGRADCREFALKTLDRILTGAWDEQDGILHRVGGPPLAGVLDDQVFLAAALLDAWEDTLASRYFRAARRAMEIVLQKFADAGGGFFDRAFDAAPLGGLDVRHKPTQDSPVPSANSMAAIVLTRLQDWTGENHYGEAARRTLEAFAGIGPDYGLFAATLGLAMLLEETRPAHVIIASAVSNPQASELERAANAVFRFGKAVVRVTPEAAASADLPDSLRQTVDGLLSLPEADGRAQAMVCAGATCYPPVEDTDAVAALLMQRNEAVAKTAA
jgi:uncharacterized protein YyaL (SSP411 family)